MKTFTTPNSLVMKYWVCDYCGSQATAAPVHATDHRFGILPCIDHARLAKRDVNAWLHMNYSVRMIDFHAKFPEVASLPHIVMYRHVFKYGQQWVIPTNVPDNSHLGLVPIISQKMIETLNTGIYRADYEEFLWAKQTFEIIQYIEPKQTTDPVNLNKLDKSDEDTHVNDSCEKNPVQESH